MIYENRAIYTITIFLVAGAMLHGVSGLANEPNKGVLEACETDIKNFCPQVTPGNGHIISCLYAYEDQISDQCALAIDDFGDSLDNLFYAAGVTLAICASDIESHCEDAKVGGGKLLSCLIDKTSELSESCGTASSRFYEKFVAE